jgi:hypothetical protein
MGDAATQLEFTQAMTDFKIMFPDMEVPLTRQVPVTSLLQVDVIEAVLRSNSGAVDTTIDQLLAMSADNEPGCAGRGAAASPPPAYLHSLPSYGEAVQGPLGASLGPDLLSSLGAAGGPGGAPLHTRRGWRPAILGRLPPTFLRLERAPGGRAYTHPERQARPATAEGADAGERRSSQISEDERFAQMLQNEEFMTELRGNPEFLSALEEDRREEESTQPQQRCAQRLAALGPGPGPGPG